MAIIEVKKLSKKFKDFTAVDKVSFEVAPGEIFAFLGPNGAGKSTTIKMLTTVLNPSSGDFRLDGYSPNDSRAKVRESFGIVFQDPSLDDELTTMENMQFHAVLYGVPVKFRKERIKHLLNFVELWDRRNDLVKTFSGGMKRRLEIARGLLHHPKILFLDEPTTGLDPQTRNHIWEYLQNLNKSEGITVFFTTHYIEEAEKIANRVAVMDNGKVIALDTPEKLKEQTSTESLEEAFLNLTGKNIRADEASNLDHLRQIRRMHKR